LQLPAFKLTLFFSLYKIIDEALNVKEEKIEMLEEDENDNGVDMEEGIVLDFDS
jgi:hypothetical protein